MRTTIVLHRRSPLVKGGFHHLVYSENGGLLYMPALICTQLDLTNRITASHANRGRPCFIPAVTELPDNLKISGTDSVEPDTGS
jgi:hypothetical protein